MTIAFFILLSWIANCDAVVLYSGLVSEPIRADFKTRRGSFETPAKCSEAATTNDSLKLRSKPLRSEHHRSDNFDARLDHRRPTNRTEVAVTC